MPQDTVFYFFEMLRNLFFFLNTFLCLKIANFQFILLLLHKIIFEGE